MKRLAGALVGTGAAGAAYLVASALSCTPGAFTWWHPAIAAFIGCGGLVVGGLGLLGAFAADCPSCKRLTAALEETHKALLELKP